MAHKCNFFADNGSSSQLFDRLYGYYAGKGMNPTEAEKAAADSWVSTRTPQFKEFVGDWQQGVATVPDKETDTSVQPTALSGRLQGFLNKLNVTTEFRDDLQHEFDAKSLTDLLYKTILVKNDYRDPGLLRETAYVAYSFLGKKNKIRTDLVHSIENLSNYQAIFDEYKKRSPKLHEYKIKEIITIDYLADAIKNNFEAPRDSYQHRRADYWQIKGDTKLERQINYWLAKLKQFLQELFTDTKLSQEEIDDLMADLANDILTGDMSKFGTDLSEEQQLTNYEETVKKDPKAKKIIDDFQNMGFLLTGSLSLRRQGTLYRGEKENLHDLDFTYTSDKHGAYFNDLIADLMQKMEGASPAGRKALYQQFGRELNKEYKKHPIISEIKKQYPQFKVKKAFSKPSEPGAITVMGQIDDYLIDLFFVNNTDLDTIEKTFQDWQPIFIAKLKMGRAKDIRDFANYVPFNQSITGYGNIKGFRNFSFNLTKDEQKQKPAKTTTPEKANVTVAIDKNGEPEMVYFGESTFFEDLPVKDYNTVYSSPVQFTFTPGVPKDTKFRYPFFVSIKHPKIINVDANFTRDDMAKATKNLKAEGYDGVAFIHTKENGEQEKLYGVLDTNQIQQVYSESNNKPNTTYTNQNNATELQSMKQKTLAPVSVTDLMRDASTTTNLLENIMQNGDPTQAKLARSIMLNSNKSMVLQKGDKKMIAYDPESEGLYVDPDLQLSREVFDSLVLAETMRGYSLQALGSEKMQGIDNIVDTLKTRYPNTKFDRYFTDSVSFLNGVFNNPAFMQYLKDTHFPGSPESVHQSVMNQLASLYGFRPSYIPYMDKVIELAAYNRKTESITLYNEDVADDIDEDVEAETNKKDDKSLKPKGFNAEAPYSQYITGDKVIDARIAVIHDKIQAITNQINNREAYHNRAKLESSRLQLEKDMKKLADEQSMHMLIEVGKSQMVKFSEGLKKGLTHNEAWSSLNLLESWSKLIDDTKGAELSRSMQTDIDNIVNKAIHLKAEYTKIAFSSTMDTILKEQLPEEYIKDLVNTDVMPDIGSITGDTIGLSFGTRGAEVINNYYIANRAAKANTGINDFERELDKLLEKNGSKDIRFIFRTDSNGQYRPICTYKDELYEKMAELDRLSFESIRAVQPLNQRKAQFRANLQKATRNGDKEGMAMEAAKIRAINQQIEEAQRNRSTWATKNEFMRNNFDYEVTSKGMEDFFKFAEEYREAFYEVSVDDKLYFKEEEYESALAKHDPREMLKWVKDPTNPHPGQAARFMKITPKAHWKNSAYNAFTPVQKEIYDFFVNEYLKAHSHIPMGYAFTDYNSDLLLKEFAYMKKETADKWKHIGKNVKDFFKDIVSVEYVENNVSFDVRGPISGKLVKKVGFKEVKKFARGTDGYYKEGEPLKASLELGLKEGRFKYMNGYLVNNIKEGKNYEKMVERFVQLEDDPLVIFKNFVKFGYNYKYKREVEDIMNAVVEMSANQPKQQDKFKGKVNALGIPMGSKAGKSEIDERLQHTTDAYLHDDFKDALVTDVEGRVPGERIYSGKQVIESINTWTRARQLGLNIASGVSNLTLGTINNFMYAGRDEFFNEKELGKAYLILKDAIASLYNGGTAKVGNSQKIMLIMQQFNMLGNLHEKMYADKEWVNKLFEHLFMFQKAGEYMNQGAVVIAMMLREKTNINGKDVSLWDSFEVKDDKLVFKHPNTKYADEKMQFRFAQAAKKVNKEIHSDYDVLNPMKAKRKLRGRVLSLFRTWLPQAVFQRIGKRYKDAELSMWKGYDVYREGRWNTFNRLANFFVNTANEKRAGVTRGDKFKNFATFLGAMLVSTISNNTGRRMLDNIEMDPVDKANMAANMKELWWLITIAISTTVMLKMKGDDDDPEDEDYIQQSIIHYLYNQTSRVENELYFFYNPWSTSTILRDAIPLWNTIEQAIKVADAGITLAAHPEKDAYQKGFRKGDSKFATQLQLFFPVSKQVQSVHSMWSQIYSNKYH